MGDDDLEAPLPVLTQNKEVQPLHTDTTGPGQRPVQATRVGMVSLIAAVIAAVIAIASLMFAARRAVPRHYQPTTYVSSGGSDSTGNGSASAPYRTLAKAQKTVRPGSTVYVRGGVYPATKLALTVSGTRDAPITYASYPGETAVLDGAGAKFNWDNVVDVRGHDIAVRGFEIRNGANAAGLAVNGGNNITLAGNRVHDVDLEGIHVAGSDVTVEDNEVYNACMNNLDGALGSGGWPAAVDTGKQSSGQASTNVTFRRNNVHDSWGEGIDTNFLAGGVIDANRSVDNYSVLIYSDDSRDIQITNNIVAVTNATHNRRNDSPARGIALAAETASQPPVNITINGNILGGTGSGIYYLDSKGKPHSIGQDPTPRSFG